MIYSRVIWWEPICVGITAQWEKLIILLAKYIFEESFFQILSFNISINTV